jgi:hypothetical protein
MKREVLKVKAEEQQVEWIRTIFNLLITMIYFK